MSQKIETLLKNFTKENLSSLKLRLDGVVEAKDSANKTVKSKASKLTKETYDSAVNTLLNSRQQARHDSGKGVVIKTDEGVNVYIYRYGLVLHK